VEAKLRGNPQECSRQGGAAMRRREGACFHCLAGSRLGQTEDEPPLSGRSPQPPPQLRGLPVAPHAVMGIQVLMVQHAIMSDTRRSCLTDEVPRRPLCGVISRYKLHAKCVSHAPVAGTEFLWPRLRGCQKRQSRFALRQAERQNLSRAVRLLRAHGIVSPMAQATKWPAGTSSRKSAGSLRNILHLHAASRLPIFTRSGT
jgi:hypothetical protein